MALAAVKARLYTIQTLRETIQGWEEYYQQQDLVEETVDMYKQASEVGMRYEERLGIPGLGETVEGFLLEVGSIDDVHGVILSILTQADDPTPHLKISVIMQDVGERSIGALDRVSQASRGLAVDDRFQEVQMRERLGIISTSPERLQETLPNLMVDKLNDPAFRSPDERAETFTLAVKTERLAQG